MIRVQKFGKLFIAFAVALGMFSCDDDEGTTAFEVIGDVFITKRMIGDEAKYARSYYTYGNQPMSEAVATTPDSDEIVMSATNNQENTWAKAASINDFETAIPTQGRYTFNVQSEDVPHVANDDLTFNNLEFTTILTADVASNILDLEWEGGTDAIGHMVRLINEEGDVIFSSVFIGSESTHILVDYPNTGTGTWATEYPNANDIYTLELHAFTFDADATDINFTYHIEEVAISEEIITWQ